MKKLLILGTTGLATDEMVFAAKKRGIYTIVTDYLPPEEAPVKLIADEYWMISTGDFDLLEEKCRAEQIDGITCGISTFNTFAVMELCKRLNLPCYCTPEAWHYTMDKRDFKDACIEVGLPVATDYYISNPPREEELDRVQYPVVVKPVDLSANRGISFCYNRDELIKACEYARSMSDNPRIIVERMLKGNEFIALYTLADGRMSLLGLISSLPQPGEPSFCYLINSSITPFIRQYLRETDAKARMLLEKIGCREGFAWIQFFRDKSDMGIYAVEMGYRLMGDLAFRAFEYVNGFNAVNWLTDYALGHKNTPDELPTSMSFALKSCACSYLMWTKRGGTIEHISGLEEIEQIPTMRITNLMKPGEKTAPYQYAICFVFAAENGERVCEIVNQINHTVRAEDPEGNDLLMQFTDFDRIRREYDEMLKESADED